MKDSLVSLMTEVIAVASEQRCAYLALKDDPFFGRLPSGSEQGAIQFALTAGQSAAQQVMSQYGRVPENIASSLQVRVNRNDAAILVGKAVLFSEYGDRPPAITIYTPPVEEANRLIGVNGLAEALGLDDVAPIHLAHELYHHLEAKKLTGGTAGYRIKTLSLGPIRIRTGLPSLSEIAADRFALALLRLRVPPKAVQFITIHHHNREYAWELLEEMKRFPA